MPALPRQGQGLNAVANVLKTYEKQLRFLVAGTVNTIGGYLLYLALQRVLPYQAAYFLAFAAGVVGAYCLNTLLVFRTRPSWRTFLAYPSIYLAQYAVSAPLLAILVEWLHVRATIAPIVVSIAMVPVSYLLNRFILTRGQSRLPK